MQNISLIKKKSKLKKIALVKMIFIVYFWILFISFLQKWKSVLHITCHYLIKDLFDKIFIANCNLIYFIYIFLSISSSWFCLHLLVIFSLSLYISSFPTPSCPLLCFYILTLCFFFIYFHLHISPLSVFVIFTCPYFFSS